ncbi:MULTISPECIES: tRNA nucleotidyltransferase [unclassified Pseudodesulfovibrio]|uniref:tRNA nucleotidyltransferase n=1 Tax=unclassified Pseudodesulfovibrio TaxID=2661612 RepID=UPI000FEBBEF9|nr:MULTISPECIES: tRNA nucleotidyltransferase [unclassified Pseudodesulfovibrio]MCJ2163806.1 tRNA nucleotidyltransferase [Pseudodesulfovibrio sp. S3-i]RWU05946.1 tRNA nucleotidyltransferase [Pseudodesulfovibrio sp. S3]
MNIYLAGGAVRDLLLGRPLSDRDYLVTKTTRKEFQKAFPNAQEVGLTFPIFLVDKTEFSFPRSDSLANELRARDLTVNAQLLDENGELICHPNGLDDLKRRILRPASAHSMEEDPLRVFRAARFWSQLPDFTPHEELLEAMQSAARKDLLKTISADRIGQEMRKVLEAPAPGNFLRLLSKTDCLLPWFSELDPAQTIPAGPRPYHDTNVLEHTCQVMDKLAGDAVAVWMGLCHDLGKSLTNEENLPHHYGHDLSGVPLAGSLAQRIRLPNALKIAGMKAARWHMVAANFDELRPGTKVDLLMDAHLSGILAPLFRLVLADHDKDFLSRAKRNLEMILPIKLAPTDMNHGAESGKKLRQLRAHVLTDDVL